MDDSVSVRQAGPADIPAIHRIQLHSGLPASEPARLEAAIEDPDRLVLVAGLDDQAAGVDGHVAGWAKTHFWPEGDGAAPAGHYLGGVAVDPDLRGRGVGGRLTLARLQWIWRRAAEAWYVTNARNTASIALHRQYGFEEVARAPRFHTTTFDGGVGILWRAMPGDRHG
ncbi:MAG TPA: N-acetyltransferase [Arthrobacter sp.]|nr:N-acetyltransferase [Arthrobacter sp.]